MHSKMPGCTQKQNKKTGDIFDRLKLLHCTEQEYPQNLNTSSGYAAVRIQTIKINDKNSNYKSSTLTIVLPSRQILSRS